jgi:hypothetical protein
LGIYEISDIVILWRLVEYVSPAGRGAITDWRDDLSIVRKADFDLFLKLKVTEKTWGYPDYRALTGKPLKELYELRWKSEGVPHRIGGYIIESENTFVMLIGFTHNAKKYDPSSALDTIVKRRKQILNGEATLNEFKVLTGQGTQG